MVEEGVAQQHVDVAHYDRTNERQDLHLEICYLDNAVPANPSVVIDPTIPSYKQHSDSTIQKIYYMAIY